LSGTILVSTKDMKAAIKILFALTVLLGTSGAIYAWQNAMPPNQQTDTAKAAKQPKAYPPPVPGQPKPDRPKPPPPNNYKQPVSPPDTSHQGTSKHGKAKLGGEEQPQQK
jgi:hypothetical protein